MIKKIKEILARIFYKIKKSKPKILSIYLVAIVYVWASNNPIIGYILLLLLIALCFSYIISKHSSYIKAISMLLLHMIVIYVIIYSLMTSGFYMSNYKVISDNPSYNKETKLQIDKINIAKRINLFMHLYIDSNLPFYTSHNFILDREFSKSLNDPLANAITSDIIKIEFLKYQNAKLGILYNDSNQRNLIYKILDKIIINSKKRKLDTIELLFFNRSAISYLHSLNKDTKKSNLEIIRIIDGLMDISNEYEIIHVSNAIIKQLSSGLFNSKINKRKIKNIINKGI